MVLDIERFGQSMVQLTQSNGSTIYAPILQDLLCLFFIDSTKLELLISDAATGTIADNLPANQTSYQWQAGKTLTGWVNPGSTNYPPSQKADLVCLSMMGSTNHPSTHLADTICLSFMGANYKVRVSSTAAPSTSGTTYYFYDSGGRLLSEYDQTGTCVKDYLYLGGKMIGEFQPSGSKYYYYASDQINSTRLVTDATGAVVHSAHYDPYGGLYKTWTDTYHPKPGFSGKEREFGSELDYFGARYYGHKQYRFLSVDPIIGKEETINNPQLWNLYAFCRNSPITFFDQNGMADDRVPKTDNKTIMVNLDDQTLKAYEKKKIVFDFNVVTGDDDHPTDKGKFTIFRKEHPYRSKKYDVQMDYAMFFTQDGKAIHQYHGPLGLTIDRLLRKISDWFGSHGCVRLNESDAKALYQWAPRGTKVEVY